MNSSLLLMAALAASLNPNCPYVCINSTVAQLNTQLAEEKSRLKLCPKNHVTRCINPAKAAIDSLSKDIEAAKGGK